MALPSRRGFLAAAAAALAGSRLLGADNSLLSMLKSGPTRTVAAEVEASPLSTLFLTWQRDPTTTMTIQWIGPVDFDPQGTDISYCADVANQIWLTQSPMVRPYPMSDLSVYRTELTGLSPDTMYQFRVGNSGPFKFRTMPAKATDAIHFISGGDCGTNAHCVNNNIQAARQDPAFALIGGDLAYENGTSAETHLAFIRNYSQTMIAPNGRLIPMVAAIGNHEVNGGYNKPRASAPFFYALFDGLYPDRSFATLDFGDYLSLVLLDTGHNSAIGGEQTNWLQRTLKARVDHPHVFIVNHVPAYPSFRDAEIVPVAKPGKQPHGGTGADNRQYWTPLFDKYRVPVVLEHHDHTFKRTHKLLGGMTNDNGVLYLGDGSWGQLRNPKSPDQLSFLAKASRDYHLSLHTIQGDERFHIALDEFGRVMDVGHSGQRKLGLVAMPA